MKLRFHPLSTALVLSLSCLGGMQAQANVINYNFSVTIDTSTSALLGQSFNGSFSYDDTDVPTLGFSGEDLFPLHSFSFDFAGNAYSYLDLSYGDAAIQATTFLGLDAGAADFAFLPSDGLFPAFFAYDFGNGDAGNGNISFATATATPEPAAAWLLGSSLLLMTALARRQQLITR